MGSLRFQLTFPLFFFAAFDALSSCFFFFSSFASCFAAPLLALPFFFAIAPLPEQGVYCCTVNVREGLVGFSRHYWRCHSYKRNGKKKNVLESFRLLCLSQVPRMHLPAYVSIAPSRLPSLEHTRCSPMFLSNSHTVLGTFRYTRILSVGY